MVGHILMRLHDAEQQQQQQLVQRYTVCVTGDHSTPIVFGDHSHEPVPFAMAQVQHAVAAMGGKEQAELRRKYMQPAHQQQQQEPDDGVAAAATAAGSASCRIPLPDVKQPPQLQELLQQAEQQQQRRLAALQGMPLSNSQASGQQQGQQQQPAGAADADSSSRRAADAAADGSDTGVGSWPEAWPQLVLGDAVVAFDELSAAKGSLGRFTGAGIMPLVKQFTGRSVEALVGAVVGA
jgi:pyruvate/2-oxoglutarate dehydrogenase complex dihydrolipoamide acyltransferase (E2) component